jgi:hypothetical protein
MTTYKVNDYDFSEVTSSDKHVLVTNNLGRTAEYAELVYLDGYFGEIVDTAGIANGATGYINIDADRRVRTKQVEATDTFTKGNTLWFVSGGASAAGTLEDADPGSGTVYACGIITDEEGTGGAQTAVEFRPFVQRLDAADVSAQVTTNTAAIGTLSSLTTSVQTDLVSAVNEVDANADTNTTNIATNAVNIGTNDTEIAALQAEPRPLYFAVTADASSGLAITGLEEGDTIIDVVVVCSATNGSGTLQVTDGTNAITDAIACAVDTTKTSMATLDDDHNVIGVGDTATVIANGAADRGYIIVTYIPA